MTPMPVLHGQSALTIGLAVTAVVIGVAGLVLALARVEALAVTVVGLCVLVGALLSARRDRTRRGSGGSTGR